MRAGMLAGEWCPRTDLAVQCSTRLSYALARGGIRTRDPFVSSDNLGRPARERTVDEWCSRTGLRPGALSSSAIRTHRERCVQSGITSNVRPTAAGVVPREATVDEVCLGSGASCGISHSANHALTVCTIAARPSEGWGLAPRSQPITRDVRPTAGHVSL